MVDPAGGPGRLAQLQRGHLKVRKGESGAGAILGCSFGKRRASVHGVNVAQPLHPVPLDAMTDKDLPDAGDAALVLPLRVARR